MAIKLPPAFPIKLEWYTVPVAQFNILGAHDNFVVTANSLEIARFIDCESAIEYIKFLTQSHFKPLKMSVQGRKLIEVLYLLYEKEKATKIDTDKKGVVIRDIKNTKFIN